MITRVATALWILASLQAIAQPNIPCGVAGSAELLHEATDVLMSKDKPQVRITYEGLADAIMNLGGTPLQTIDCPGGTTQCLLVTKMNNGSPDLGICGAQGDPDARCIVSDEFSLAGVILSMAHGRTHTDRFHAWFNMLQILRGVGGAGPDPLLLPAWVARVDFDAGGTSVTRTSSDDAIDGSARSAIALYIAAHSSAFDAARRADYLSAANQLAASILEHDFVHQTFDLRGRTGRVLMAGSRNQALGICTATSAETSSCDKDAYAGYFGDVVIMLLMAHSATGDADYLDAARDTLQAYFLAAGFGPTIDQLRVPPITWAWWDDPATSAHTLAIVCKDHEGFPCDANQWDGHDAPRAASLCKAAYYWRLLGLEPEADLETYCSKWASKGLTLYGQPTGTPGYYRQYSTTTGNPVQSDETSLNSMAVGTNHLFYCGSDETLERFFVTFNNHFELTGTAKFEGGPNFYEAAPAIINYGTAIGRDLPAFGAPRNLRAQAGDGSVTVQWDPLPNTTQYQLSRRVGTGSWSPIVVGGTSHTEAVSNVSVYSYRVQALRTGSLLPTPFSNTDIAVPLALHALSLPGMIVKASHINQLRSAVTGMEAVAGIPSEGFTDPTLTPGSTPIIAIHFTQLRSRLDTALDKLGIAASVNTDAAIGHVIRATDLQPLRDAVR